MPVYVYQRNKSSWRHSQRRAGGQKQGRTGELLKRQQIKVTKMSEKGKEFNLPTFGGGVKAKELAIFTRQFSVMIDAGLPLVQCLEILGGQQENKTFQKVLPARAHPSKAAATLSAAMRQYEKVFDPLYVNMVEAGETGGILDTILQRLSGYIEKNVKLKRAVQVGHGLSGRSYSSSRAASSPCCSGRSCRFSPPCSSAWASTCRCPRAS